MSKSFPVPEKEASKHGHMQQQPSGKRQDQLVTHIFNKAAMLFNTKLTLLTTMITNSKLHTSL